MNIAKQMGPDQLLIRFKFLLESLDEFPEGDTSDEVQRLTKELDDISEIVFGIRSTTPSIK